MMYKYVATKLTEDIMNIIREKYDHIIDACNTVTSKNGILYNEIHNLLNMEMKDD